MISSIKMLIKFLPIHFIVLFTLIGLILYHLVRSIGDGYFFFSSKAKRTVPSASLIMWGIIFVCLYGHPVFAALTVVMALLVYGLCRLLIKTSGKSNKKLLLVIGIVLSLGMLILFKYPVLKKELPLVLQVKSLGISYFTFKFLHVLIDTYRGRIKELDLLTFGAFIFFFPTFSAGPIDRYGRFRKDLQKEQEAKRTVPGASLEKEDVDVGITRIIYGLFKKFIIGDKTGILISKLAPDILKAPVHILWIVVFLYSIRIYYDFSGYSDIAIGLGRLFGIKVPENFNKPYIKRNLVQFWQNWHMTLTSWLREYLFMPLGKGLMGKVGAGHPWFINSVCQVVTMAAVGIWHGSTVSFLIWGLYHGVGLALYRIYSDLLKRYGSEKFLGWLSESKAAFYASMAVNFVFVSIGWVFFSFKWDTALKIVMRLMG